MIPDSKTPNGIAEIPLTLWPRSLKSQLLTSEFGPFLFPSDKNPAGYHRNLKTTCARPMRLDLAQAVSPTSRSLNSSDRVTPKSSKSILMRLQMKREALEKMDR